MPPDDETTGSLGKISPEYRSFVLEFMAETDRAAVVLGASKLDHQLYMILKKVLLPCPARRDDLFDGESGLGTFSAKIDMAYRLGLIDAGFARHLHLIRKIRNDFAHDVSGCSLDSGPHKDRVLELVGAMKAILDFDELAKLLEGSLRWSWPSTEFRIILGWTVTRLDNLLKNCGPLSGGGAMDLAGLTPARGETRDGGSNRGAGGA
jgi:hypothetical protein